MKIAIDLSEQDYELACKYPDVLFGTYAIAIKNGTPLPEDTYEDAEYKKDLNEMKEQILKEGNTLLTKQDLLERLCEIDKEYNGRPWNLLQILANVNILIGQEPCEDVISRTAAIDAMTHWFSDMLETGKEKYSIDDVLNDLPPVTPIQKWIPCSKDLPKKAFGCLVTVEEDDIHGEPQRVIYPNFVGYDGETWNDADGKVIPFDVIAWMPAPIPYEAE